MRKASTQTVSINADYDKAFDYISNPLTQKEWAINFMKDVKKEEDNYIAVTPFGEMPLVFNSDKETGVIDILLGNGVIPTRLLKNGNGCEYQFTLFKSEEMPDVAWENEGIPGLIAELNKLKSILENI